MDPRTEEKRRRTKILLIVTTSIFGVLMLPDLAVALFTPFLFDSPSATDHTGVVLFAAVIISYPVVYLLSMILGWVFYSLQKYLLATIAGLLPLINIVMFMVYVAIIIANA
jgi:hypothetical protein